MNLHYFDRKNRLYTHTSPASIDPLESEKAGQSVYMINIPFATVKALPASIPADHSAQFDIEADDWALVENHMGKATYSTTDKSAKVIDEVGPIPAGYTELVPGEFDSWEGGVWVTDAAAQLADAQTKKLAAINTMADAALSSVTSAYPATERSSWDKQESEARAWLVDNNTATPLLDGIIAGRGMDKATLVGKVIDKADIFVGLAGGVFGKRQAFEDAVLAASSVAEVGAIVISFGT